MTSRSRVMMKGTGTRRPTRRMVTWGAGAHLLLALLGVAAGARPTWASARSSSRSPTSDTPVCPAAEPTPGPGVIDPFHVPAPAAAQLNADGKILYRQGRWEQAREKYRTAQKLDPDFQAPALNVACSFVRQERFAEAVAEVMRLIEHAYLPWSQEVLAAADLGALKIRPEGKQVRAALDAARSRWAEGLQNDLILVARLRPALKLGEPTAPSGPAPAAARVDGRGVGAGAVAAAGTGEQALVLGQRQEVFAWSPRTRRYRQLTSEDGRVLAVARSADGRRIAFVTAEKLLRGPGGTLALRGVAIAEVDLGNLVPLGRGAVVGDVRRVEILPAGLGFSYRIEVGPSHGSAAPTFVLTDAGLEARPAPRAARPLVVLTGQGASSPARDVPLPGGCPGTARELRPAGHPPTVVVIGARRKSSAPALLPPLVIGGPHAAGLAGLPIP